MRAFTLLVLSLGVLVAGANPAWADVIWDEAVNGDISGDQFAPSVGTLTFGTNSLIAASVSGDREYIVLSVPVGMQLDSIIQSAWTGDDQVGFIAIQIGTVFTEPPTGTNVANLLGYSHFGPGVFPLGDDILDDIGLGSGSMGFTPPLLANDYVYWIQQTSTNLATYQLDFVVTPEPASLAILALAGLLALRRR